MQLRLLDSRSATYRERDLSDTPVLRAVDSASAVTAPSVRFWRPLPQNALDLICGEGLVLGTPLQAHEWMQVLLPVTRMEVVDGAGRATILGPTSVHLTTHHDLHAIRRLGATPIHLRMLLVAADGLPKIRGAAQTSFSEGSLRWTQRVVDDPEMHRELSALFDELRRPVVALDRATQLTNCLGRVLARPEGRVSSGRPDVVSATCGAERARDYLREHVPDALSLDELATIAGLSKFYLLRAFRRAYGLTPHAYQMQLRLARARRLIADGRALSYVTYESGFADQSHLTRRFATFYGLTPARFARQLKMPLENAARGAAVTNPALTPSTAA
ncbi:MAG TPA: AraC family transcriptional regulator [Gemmatimonadaceae bacterium]|nr:AraC family transcriptional regulator [Gemmatimonadaceae bacterium]